MNRSFGYLSVALYLASNNDRSIHVESGSDLLAMSYVSGYVHDSLLLDVSCLYNLCKLDDLVERKNTGSILTQDLKASPKEN